MSSSQVQDTAAVIPTLTCPDVPIEVWIEVDGKQVPYYSREHDEDKKEVTCWIESEAGKVRFSLSSVLFSLFLLRFWKE